MLKKAFTLIELLVVIAIIAILASMMMPTLTGAEEGAEYATCMSNMKQSALSQIFYMNDNGDWLAINTGWGGMGFPGGQTPAFYETWWFDHPKRQGQFAGIRPPSAGPGCWPPYAAAPVATNYGCWPNKIYKYNPVQQVGDCPSTGGAGGCGDLSPWGLVGYVGAIDWEISFNEDAPFTEWKDGAWGFGQGRGGGSSSGLHISSCTHPGDTILIGHKASSEGWRPAFSCAFPIYFHPVYGAVVDAHNTSTGVIHDIQPPEWPKMDRGPIFQVGKQCYLMVDGSVRGFEYQPAAWDMTRLGLGARAANNLEHNWPP